MSSAVSNAGMEAYAPLINAIVNSAVFHSNSHINQMPLQIVHILRFFGRLAAPDFVMILSGLFGSQKSGSLYRSVALLHLQEAANGARISGLTELAEKITTSRIYQK